MLIKGEVIDGKQEVTFVLPKEAAGGTVFLCGDFNDWSDDALQMHRDSHGNYVVTTLLKPGQRYRYRYLVDGERWENDWQADDYVRNEYGGEDSLVET